MNGRRSQIETLIKQEAGTDTDRTEFAELCQSAKPFIAK